MTYLSPLLLLAGLYLLILISPGPNFFILSQLALDGKHRQARHVAFGITTSSITWAVLVLAGLATLLAQHSWLASAVRLLGAAYLVWYGGRLLLIAATPARTRKLDAMSRSTSDAPLYGYRTGLLTGLTNPKGAAFWTSAFAAAFPAHAPAWLYPATILLIAAMSLGWHLGITLLFASRPLRMGYLRLERSINGLAGGVLVGLGLHRMVVR